MLPSTARLRHRRDFGETVRRGTRAGRPLLVVHLDRTSGRDGAAPRSHPGDSPRVGFVVSRAVGGSVVRHTVARRLRHLVRDRLDRLPAGCSLVVRALPAAATASSAQLGADLDAALERAVRRSDPAAGTAVAP
ncbi:MAG: ribonuclease P protein component [Candidatus Nanopelagicales bacterium]